MLKLSCISFVGLVASASLTYAQNTNQAAVDTLTKGVAKAVFAEIKQPKAQEIYAKLLVCGDGCDPQQVIRGVGSWDQVGAKMQELSELKNTARFIAMSPADANVAIRNQLAQFYSKYKDDRNYGKPLSPPVQAILLAKIDALLPPTATSAPAVAAAPTPSDTITDEKTSVTPVALQISQLERKVRDEQEKQFWMILVSAFVGLLVGAAAVYLLVYRAARTEIQELMAENRRLSHSLDVAQRPKPTNESRQPQNDYRQKANAYDDIRAELGTNIDPLVAIRQLKQQASSSTPNITPSVRVATPERNEPIAETTVPTVPVQSQPTPVQPTNTPRSEVFYFPPPDPSGQFDNEQKSSTLSPESAYRFSIEASARKDPNSDQPIVASFRFEAEPGRVARFLTYRNYMIEPACESENSYFATHTRIIMRRDGEAVLENGVWRVKKKALIRYE
jgi:hypothetical protein